MDVQRWELFCAECSDYVYSQGFDRALQVGSGASGMWLLVVGVVPAVRQATTGLVWSWPVELCTYPRLMHNASPMPADIPCGTQLCAAGRPSEHTF